MLPEWIIDERVKRWMKQIKDCERRMDKEDFEELMKRYLNELSDWHSEYKEKKNDTK